MTQTRTITLARDITHLDDALAIRLALQHGIRADVRIDRGDRGILHYRATDITGPHYSDPNLGGDGTYFYVVSGAETTARGADKRESDGEGNAVTDVIPG